MVSLPSIYFAAGVACSIGSCFIQNKKKGMYHWALVTLLALVCFVKALLNVKVGIDRKLGIAHTSGGRRLGLLERWYVAHTRAGVHTGFMVAMEMHGATAMSSKDVKETLTRVSKRFPWLRARLRRDGVQGVDSRRSLNNNKGNSVWGDDFYINVEADLQQPFGFRELSSVPLVDVFQEEGRTLWHDEDPSKPLWRVTMVRSNTRITLVLAFHHLITDGVGAMAIVEAILEEHDNSGHRVEPHMEALPPPMEDITDTVPRLGHLLVPVLLDRFPKLTSYLKPSPHWQGKKHVDVPNGSMREPHMLCLNVILRTELPFLERYRKMNGLSINTLLVTTLTKAIAGVQLAENPKDSTILHGFSGKVLFNIDCAADERRRRANLPPTALGSYLSGAHVSIQVGSDCETRALGHSFQTKLYHSLQTSIMDIGMTKFINEDWIDFASKFCDKTPNGVQSSLDISNLGMQDPKQLSTNLWFAQGQRGTAAALQVSVIGGPQGYNAVISAFPSAVSKTTLGDIADAWRQEITVLK
jgi:hypothetical protein